MKFNYLIFHFYYNIIYKHNLSFFYFLGIQIYVNLGKWHTKKIEDILCSFLDTSKKHRNKDIYIVFIHSNNYTLKVFL